MHDVCDCDLNTDHKIIVIMISAIIQQTYNHTFMKAQVLPITSVTAQVYLITL